MSPRERRKEHPDEAGRDPQPSHPTSNLDAVRQAGQQFLAAADEAIARALSGDSEAFLRASRQQGGE